MNTIVPLTRVAGDVEFHDVRPLDARILSRVAPPLEPVSRADAPSISAGLLTMNTGRDVRSSMSPRTSSEIFRVRGGLPDAVRGAQELASRRGGAVMVLASGIDTWKLAPARFAAPDAPQRARRVVIAAGTSVRFNDAAVLALVTRDAIATPTVHFAQP